MSTGARARLNRSFLAAACVTVVAALSGCSFAGPSHALVGGPPASLRARPVSFNSASGAVIRGWLSPGRAHTGAVLLLHGMGANRTAMLGRAEFLRRQGFTVLAVDFQAHGESDGDHVTFGARESLDAAAALAVLRDAAPGERVGVIGVSMGGAASLLGPGPLAVNAFVLESVYPTIRDAVRDRLETWFGPLRSIGALLTSPALALLQREADVTEAELQPIDRIRAIHAPLLMLAGSDDPYTTLAEAESLYAQAPFPKQFWVVAGAGHEDLQAYAPAEYERRVGAFLVATLSSGDSATALAARR